MDTIKDITDFRDQFGGSALLASIERTTQPFHSKNGKAPAESIKLPAIVNAGDLVNRPLIKPPELIKGLLHQGSKMVLGGGSKSYKTWSLLDLGMSVATGKPWWGFDTEQTKVLYINLELPEWSFASRMNEIITARPEVSHLDKLDTWNLRGYAASLDMLTKQFIEKAGENYGLIIIDPIYKVYGDRDENSAGEMGIHLQQERMDEDEGAYFLELYRRACGLTSKCRACNERPISRLGLTWQRNGNLGMIGLYCSECEYMGGSATAYHPASFFVESHTLANSDQLRITKEIKRHYIGDGNLTQSKMEEFFQNDANFTDCTPGFFQKAEVVP